MLSGKVRVIFGCLIVLGLFLRNTGFTSADLFAEREVKNNRFSMTTLSFDELNTANNIAIDRLFEVSGLVPGGFAVGSVRVKKTGLMEVKYVIKTKIVSGDETFCKAIDLQLMQNASLKTRTPLNEFNYQSSINSDTPQDFVFFLSLNKNDSGLRNKNCQFNFVLTTQGQNGPKKGIYAERQLLNYVVSGNWD